MKTYVVDFFDNTAQLSEVKADTFVIFEGSLMLYDTDAKPVAAFPRDSWSGVHLKDEA